MTKKPERRIPSGAVALKKIFEGTSGHTGMEFFIALVKNLAELLDAHGVWVAEHLKEQNRLRSIAFWLDGSLQDTYEYSVPGTPCERVLSKHELCHVPEKVIELYPRDKDLQPLGAVSYMGLALRDDEGNVMGNLALLDDKPMDEIPEAFSIFKIFASRAESELKRMRYEKLLLENEGKLNRLVNGAMDALIEFNDSQLVTQANESALRTFKANRLSSLIGLSLREFMDSESYRKLTECILHLDTMPEPFCSSSIQGTMNFINSEQIKFPAESTLSKYRFDGHDYYALFIRNVEERIKDRQAIRQLNVEAAMLREKVSVRQFNDMIGSSPAMGRVIAMVNQVAPTESTVLIRGETGTGKELVARAIHQAGLRREKPMVTLNCAALPGELVESELFGHVKGAFTGATASREGRFLLANGGTIFLDEIGELPLSLQAKLLRVLQEGEFEPVGSSKTQKVDVRVIAATNRDLEDEVKAGKFREDLYYRLNVFPIYVPPLRERDGDIIELANAFREKFARQMGVAPIHPFNESDRQRLMSYRWPGNVRELQNIIERAVITNHNGKLNLTGFSHGEVSNTDPPDGNERIWTEPERIAMDRNNIVRALEATNWKISGSDGAAALLDIPPTTLSSRIRKLGIRKPRRDE